VAAAEGLALAVRLVVLVVCLPAIFLPSSALPIRLLSAAEAR
jgi:hypothetical protein